MSKKEFIIIADYSEDYSVTKNELCDICNISENFLRELIANEIVPLDLQSESEWLFPMSSVERIRTVVRLQRDLDVNIAGSAVILDLLDEMEELKKKLRILERHLQR